MPHNRLNDQQAHDRALEHFAAICGAQWVDCVLWDLEHQLQGHVDVAGQHLVLIATRDDEHEPLVLSESDWDALRRGCRTPVPV